MRRDRFAEAVSLFAGLALIDAETLVADNAYDKRIFGAAAGEQAADCAFRVGDYGEAARWYGVAERGAPDNVGFRTKRLLAEMRHRRARSSPGS
jgi:hypothetical protein